MGKILIAKIRMLNIQLDKIPMDNIRLVKIRIRNMLKALIHTLKIHTDNILWIHTGITSIRTHNTSNR